MIACKSLSPSENINTFPLRTVSYYIEPIHRSPIKPSGSNSLIHTWYNLAVVGTRWPNHWGLDRLDLFDLSNHRCPFNLRASTAHFKAEWGPNKCWEVLWDFSPTVDGDRSTYNYTSERGKGSQSLWRQITPGVPDSIHGEVRLCNWDLKKQHKHALISVSENL